jgi:hypothetical protein
VPNLMVSLDVETLRRAAQRGERAWSRDDLQRG